MRTDQLKVAFTVKRRTFEALKHVRGTSERMRLNLDPVTSEYMPSYKYVLCDAMGQSTCFTYRTKAEAELRGIKLFEKV